MEKEEKKLGRIFLTMFRIGCFTYGGGWSIFAQLEEEFGEKRGWLTKEEFLDIMSLARSFPGIMVINMSVMFGYRVRGVPGAMAAVFGLAAPAFIVISVVTCCYEVLMQNHLVARAMIGVRCSIVPIMIMAAARMKKYVLEGRITCLLAAASFLLCLFSGINKLVMIVAAGLCGMVIWRGKGPGESGQDKEGA